jgi:hypothetical protein
MKNNNEVKANTKSATKRNLPKGTTTKAKGGNINRKAYIYLEDNFLDIADTFPSQLRLALVDIVWNEFSGECTIEELDNAWNESEHLDINGGKYTQGIVGKTGQGSFWVHYVTGDSKQLFTEKQTARKGSLTNDEYAKYMSIK